MGLFAISDLHLSLYNEKPMDIFGDEWKEHHIKIKENWNKNITEDDTILIPGDISWAMNLVQAEPDLEFIETLPGKKILLSGNHDYWWGSTSLLNEKYENMQFMKNNFFTYQNYAICGTRGWVCPNDTFLTPHDKKIYAREISRLKFSLDAAVKANFSNIIVMLHYPPTNDKKEASGFTDLLKEYAVEKVIYGHLHGENSFHVSFEKFVDGIEYFLVSADYVKFNPVKII